MKIRQLLFCLTLAVTFVAWPVTLAPVDRTMGVEAVPDPGDGGASASVQDRYIVAFDEDVGLRPGDTYLGERVVVFMEGLNVVVVEVSDWPTFEQDARLDERVRYVQWDDPAYGRLTATTSGSAARPE